MIEERVEEYVAKLKVAQTNVHASGIEAAKVLQARGDYEVAPTDPAERQRLLEPQVDGEMPFVNEGTGLDGEPFCYIVRVMPYHSNELQGALSVRESLMQEARHQLEALLQNLPRD